MEKPENPTFKYVDCIELYVPELEQGPRFYCGCLGLKVIWKSENAIGLGMAEGKTEIVLQNERQKTEVDIKVDSVIESIEYIKKAGGEVVYGPFDIKIGKCAVVKDPWNNQYVILDTSKGRFVTDEDGNITGLE